MTDIATTEPIQVYVGDTVQWEKSLADYPASDSWVLRYALRNASAKIDITATASDDDHLVSVAASVSTDWAAGDYEWVSWVEKSGEKHTIDHGAITILPDLSAANTYDYRTHAKKVLDAIEAVLEGRAAIDQEELTLDGQQLKRTPITELLKLRDKYRVEAQREEEAEKIRKGLGTGRKVFTRFT